MYIEGTSYPDLWHDNSSQWFTQGAPERGLPYWVSHCTCFSCHCHTSTL